MGFEVDQRLHEQRDKTQALLSESENIKKNNDNLVSKNLNSQNEAIKAKLEARRNASFNKSTLSLMASKD